MIDLDLSDLRSLSPMVLDGFGVRSVVALGLPNSHPSHPIALRIPGDRATPQRGATKALRRSAAEIPRRARIRWLWAGGVPPSGKLVSSYKAIEKAYFSIPPMIIMKYYERMPKRGPGRVVSTEMTVGESNL